MFDERKFDNLAKMTEKMLDKVEKEGNLEAHKEAHDNMMTMVDMLLEELEKDSQKRRKRLEEYFNG